MNYTELINVWNNTPSRYKKVTYEIKEEGYDNREIGETGSIYVDNWGYDELSYWFYRDLKVIKVFGRLKYDIGAEIIDVVEFHGQNPETELLECLIREEFDNHLNIVLRTLKIKNYEDTKLKISKIPEYMLRHVEMLLEDAGD